MSKILRVETDDELDEHFNGILIEVSDTAGTYHVPGWECKTCGWKVGALSYPPGHTCPDAGIKQKQLRVANNDE